MSKATHQLLSLLITMQLGLWLGCQQAEVAQTMSSIPSIPTNSTETQSMTGTWKGKYAEMDDVVVIEDGENPNEFLIHLHASFQNAPTVTGQRESADSIKVLEQEISGAPGTVELSFHGEQMTMKQSGLGMTLTGKYRKVNEMVGRKVTDKSNQLEFVVPLPPDKPSDIPIYPNGRVTMVFGKQVKTIRMETEDSLKQVQQFFEREIELQGWEIVNSTPRGIQALKTNRQLHFNILSHRDNERGRPVELVIQYASFN